MPSDPKPALTPKLRFPEFRDTPGWTSKALHTIAEPVSDRADNEDQNNILTLSGEHGLVLQSEYFGKQIAGANSERYLKIRRDDFVYNDRTTKASEYGTIKRLTKHPHGIVSPIYKCFRFKVGELPVFWEWYFESGAHQAQLRSLANEGARAGRFNVSIDRFLSTSVCTPERSKAEQQKIAECLSTLDELIGAESQKLDALKAHKKGLMQQLFPREGETLPRLRFPEFHSAPEWKIDELSTYLSRVIDYRGKAPPKSESGIPLITAKNVRLGWLDMSNDEYIEADEYDEWMTKGIPNPGDILFTTEAPLGNVARFPDGGKFALGQRIITLQTAPKKCLSDFLFQALLSPSMQKAIDFHSTGSAAKGIKSSVFVTLKLSAPGIAEQHRIATCLSSLDELIAAQSDRLSALQTHKQGLLQQLFPSPATADA